MLGYVTIGTDDLERATGFYDALLRPLDVARVHSFARGVFYGHGRREFGVLTPFDGAPAAGGNGPMVALEAPSRALVDELHALALSLGGTDEGAAGPRGTSGFYGGYVRDPDGNKICFFNLG